jgi:predicted Zn-dependent protease
LDEEAKRRRRGVIMGWATKRLATLFITGLASGCAGAGHQMPAISEADSARAVGEIGRAPDLTPMIRNASENERLARQALTRLHKAARPICAARDRGACLYTLEFSPKGKMNAFVWKDQIVLFNGLAQYLETEDEFAAVIGHEMGHHLARHYEKALLNRKIGAAIAGALFAGIASATDAYENRPYRAQSDLRTAMKIGEAIGDISFSKTHEREADHLAAYLMARAGYDPDAADALWVKLAKASGRMKTQLFDTHPAGPDRLAAWQKSVDEVRYSADLMPNPKNAKEEPRLQLARTFVGSPEAFPAMAAADVMVSRPDIAPRSDKTGFGKALVAKKSMNADFVAPPPPDGTWSGRGAYDSCGATWIITVKQQGSALRGNLWWAGIKYDIYGDLDRNGRTGSARAGKSKEARNQPAPRFFDVELDLAPEGATGRYSIEGQGQLCQAGFSLSHN